MHNLVVLHMSTILSSLIYTYYYKFRMRWTLAKTMTTVRQENDGDRRTVRKRNEIKTDCSCNTITVKPVRIELLMLPLDMGCNSIKANYKYRYCREVLVSSNNSVASTNRKVFNRNGSTLVVLPLTIPKPSQQLVDLLSIFNLRNNCVHTSTFWVSNTP